MTRATMAVVLMVGVLVSVADAQLRLRGQQRDDERAVVRVDPQGVVVSEPDGRESMIGWHVVKLVDGKWASEHYPHADLAWRAWARLSRGDHSLAEGLFEKLSGELDSPGMTSAVAASGLVSCRLARGAYVGATVSWASLRSMSGAAAELSNSDSGQWMPIDRATLLVPELPPIFRASASLTQIEQIQPDGEPVLGWYRAAAAFELGLPVDAPAWDPSTGGPLDLDLVSAIVMARIGEPLQRRDARARLQELQAEHEGTWIEAWCRAGIGRSLIAEGDRASVLRGAIAVLHVPIRFPRRQPWLATTCQAEAALAMSALGKADGASSLAAELVRRWPGSASANDPAVRSLVPAQSRPVLEDPL